MTIDIRQTYMDATRSGEWATNPGAPGVWRVSWLDGHWTRDQAYMALQIAELVAINPPINHPYWRSIENFLSELGVDPARLDVLIDPDDEIEEEDA